MSKGKKGCGTWREGEFKVCENESIANVACKLKGVGARLIGRAFILSKGRFDKVLSIQFSLFTEVRQCSSLHISSWSHSTLLSTSFS